MIKDLLLLFGLFIIPIIILIVIIFVIYKYWLKENKT